MKNNIEKDLKKYYKDISKALPRDRKKEIICNIKSSVDSYLADNPNAKIDEVIAYIGTPDNIADEYYSNETGKEITKKIKIGKKIVSCVITILILVFIVYIIVMAKIVIDDNKADHGSYSQPVLGETMLEEISPTNL